MAPVFWNIFGEPWAETKLSEHQLRRSRVKLCSLTLSGCLSFAVFPVCVLVMQRSAWKPLRLTSNLKSAPVFGAISFVFSHCLASLAFAVSFQLLSDRKLHLSLISLSDGLDYRSMRFFVSNVFGSLMSMDTLEGQCLGVSLVANLTLFHLLGGRLRSLLPSHLLAAGAFAKGGVPCSIKSASKNQKETIQLLGAKYGCHTCGSKLLQTRLVNSIKNGIKISKVSNVFIADHQPPKGVVLQSFWTRYQLLFQHTKHFDQMLYPHCNKCSLKQAHLVRFLSEPSSSGSFSPSNRCSTSLISKSIVSHSISSFARISYLWVPFVACSFLNENDVNYLKSSAQLLALMLKNICCS